jgi:hypothetical protein
MGFVSDLHCPACGFRRENVAIGLTAGCTAVLSLAQDQLTGELRQIETGVDEINDENGGRVGSDQESADALEAIVARQLRPTERWIAPGQAFCPSCRGGLDVDDRGIM